MPATIRLPVSAIIRLVVLAPLAQFAQSVRVGSYPVRPARGISVDLARAGELAGMAGHERPRAHVRGEQAEVRGNAEVIDEHG